MPRKGLRYYDDEDAYDYDEDYEEEEEQEQEQEHQRDQTSSAAAAGAPFGSWACAICTFENDEQLQACEMCGGFRNSEPAAERCETEPSQLAKSLFTPLSAYKVKKGKALKTPAELACSSSGTVPFKFDSPSPDDRILGAQQAKSAPRAVTESQNVAKPLEPTRLAREAKPSEPEKPTRSEPAKVSELQTVLERSTLENDASYQAKYRGLPLESYKPEPWMLQAAKGLDKHLLHLVVVGHVDAGKSTLMGRILHTIGRISQKEMRKNQKEATEMGKGSFAYAWALDEGSEERARGVTITVAVAHFETPKLRVVLLDAPGHKDFVPNMISGAAQADAAVLVVDASTGGFEAGMEGDGKTGGQTREHAQLVRSMGINQLVVAVNKMDTVRYSQGRFAEIRGSLGPFLRQCGFRDSGIIWVPVSASEGQNLSTSPTNDVFRSWFKGPTLLEALDKFEPPSRDVSKPFRLAIAEVVRTRTLGATGVGGKIETGAIKIGSKVMVMPCREVAIVKSLEHDGQSQQVARAGDSVDIGLQGVDTAALVPGGMLCHPDYLVPVATRVELRILTLKLTVPILRGSQLVVHVHHAKVPASVAELTSLLDPKTGEPVRRSPRCLTSNQSAIVEIVPERAVCLEEYAKFRGLGRVVLRSGGSTLAVGIVTRISSQV